MDKIYSGAAAFGLIEAKASLIWNGLVGIIFIIASILILYNYNKKPHVKSENNEEKSQAPNWIALILTIVGLLMIGGSYYKYYMASRSETYAAMSGASLVTNNIGDGLKNLTGISIPVTNMSGGYFYTDTEL